MYWDGCVTFLSRVHSDYEVLIDQLPPRGYTFLSLSCCLGAIMEVSQLNWIADFIWGIADDMLRDLYVRGKYRDVILPMTALRRLDAVLEPAEQAVLDMKASLDAARVSFMTVKA